MSDDGAAGVSRPFDPFELLTAILLGLAAVGASVASLQGGQWGGKQLEAFAAANSLTTKAAKQYNEDTVLMNADYAAVAAAKQHVLEARDARDPVARDRHFTLASYLYTTQLTDNAYDAMELPREFFVQDEEEAPGHATATAAPAPPPTTPAAAAAEDDEPEGDAPAATVAKDVPDEALLESLEEELVEDPDYATGMLAEGNDMFTKADAKFEEGRQANETGDKFDLAGVFFTVALFFGGLGLVFKTSMRWGFFGTGALVFAGAAIYVFTLPWA
jgi:hypothetical protein